MAGKTPTLGLNTIDVNDRVVDSISKLSENFNIIDRLYPIGTIYQSTRPTNPATFIGGRWTPIQERFLFGASTQYLAGSTGGEFTHRLTESEMPQHAHYMSTRADGWGDNNNMDNGFVIEEGRNTKWWGGVYYAGGNDAHNNMPPYKAVYMWERVG